MTSSVTENEHLHCLGHACNLCGYVAVPARFYAKEKDIHNTGYEEALEKFQAWLETHPRGVEWERILGEIDGVRVVGKTEDGDALTEKVCNDCGSGFEGYGRSCGKCRKAKSRARLQEA